MSQGAMIISTTGSLPLTWERFQEAVLQHWPQAEIRETPETQARIGEGAEMWQLNFTQDALFTDADYETQLAVGEWAGNLFEGFPDMWLLTADATRACQLRPGMTTHDVATEWTRPSPV